MGPVHLIALLGVLTWPVLALAGFFGPNTYEECVLDLMKGQEKALLSTAQAACRKKFPEEREFSLPQSAWKWKATGPAEITVEVTVLPETVALTRADGAFWEKCKNDDPATPRHEAVVTRSRLSNTFVFKNANGAKAYKCASVFFYGVER